MRNAHEPSSDFVERLEWQVSAEARRRNRAAERRQWTPPSRLKMAVAVVGLVVVSMGAGAAAVAAAYEAQKNERRDQLITSFEQRADLARQRLALAESELQAAERRLSTGVASQTEVLEARLKMVEAQSQVKSMALQLEEIRLTGQDPRAELSAPQVSGRDFVGERLRIEMAVPETALAIERERVRDAETRFSVGLASALDVEVARSRVLELESALETFRRKIEIRQRFVSGQADAVETELRVLETEAEQRRKRLTPKLDLAAKEIARIKGRVQVGVANPVELQGAELRRMLLAAELLEADLDLALIQRRILQHRSGR